MRCNLSSITATSIRRSILLLLTTSILIYNLGADAQPAYAATITVNNAGDTVADDGFCTLREAIISANNDSAPFATAGECADGAGADTIVFLGGSIITLTGGQLPYITSDMTIFGDGAGITIIQANAAPNTANYNVFTIVGAVTVELTRMTIRHGDCDGTLCYNGGGIYNEFGTLYVSYSEVTANAVSGAGAAGGGIFNNQGTVIVSDTTVSGNTAQWFGGGIGNAQGTMILISLSVVRDNTATLFHGGGIYNNNGMLTVYSSSILGNTAGVFGGGIYSIGGTVTVDGGNFVNANTANTGGGGIYAQNGTLNVVGSIVGGTLGGGNSAGGAGGAGGGIYVYDNTTTVDNSTVSANTADTNGGGIYCLGGTLNVVDSTIGGAAAADGNQANSGGGIECSGTTTITNSTIQNNVADTFSGGGINNAGTLTVTGSTVSNNQATDGGGLMNGGTVNSISNSTFSGNAATSISGFGGGGAISNAGGAITSISGSTFSGNTADAGAGNGGGIHLMNSATIGTISNTTFTGNSAAQGGGMMVNNSSVTGIADSTFSGNSAGYGGGIAMMQFSTITTISNSSLSGNNATTAGGIGMQNSTISTISRSTFSTNTSTQFGGGILLQVSTITDIVNSTFSGNSAAFQGGGIHADTSTISNITNSTFSGNTAVVAGGGISNAGGTIAAITNSFIASSTGGDCSGTIPTGTGNLDDDGTCSGGWGTITPGVDYNATLANNGGPTQTHALLPGSVAVNATGVCPAVVGGVDQRGVVRDAACDIGAFESPTLAVLAACNGPDLSVTILAGDANFNISADDPGAATQTQNNVALGTYTLASSTGYGTWTNITVTELGGDTETLNVPDVTCSPPSAGGGVSATGDVMIDVVVDPHEAEIDDSVLWTIKVWNPSSSPSGAVVVTGTFPSGLKPLTGTLSTTRGVASFNEQTLTVEGIGSLGPGEEVRITVSTEVVNASANLTTRNQTAPVMLCVTGRALGATDMDCLNLPGELPGTGGPSPVGAMLYSLLPILIAAGLIGVGGLTLARHRRHDMD